MKYASGKIYSNGFPCTGGLKFEMTNVEIGDKTATGRVCHFRKPRVRKDGEVYEADKYITGNMLVYNGIEPEVICLDHVTIDATECSYGKIVTFTFKKRTTRPHPYAELIEGIKED